MYLYKWILTPEESAHLFKDDLYLVHQEVWKMFGEGTALRPFLYRAVGPDILVQSSSLVVHPPQVGTLLGKEIPESLEGMYRLTATLNPVVDKSRMSEGKKNSARVPLGKEADILAWAADRLLKNGLSLKSLLVSPHTRRTSRLKGITVSTVEVTGVVLVTDPVKAVQALMNGIGKEKSFGCGMLCLTKIDGTSSDESEESDD